MKKRRQGAGLLALAMALVGCDYFYDVTVPASDSTPPVAWAAVYRAEVYEAISGGTQTPLSFEVADPNLYYLVIAAGTDAGGTRKVTMNHEFTRTCVQGDLGQNTSGLLAPFVDTQSGSVGSTVSNGVWTGPLVRLSDYATCNPGWTLSYVAYEWTATAEDFHGNTATHGWARMYWTP
ncbi:hypothetical protein OV203_15390 [Nannocystis sp. ILAH1]|uniref:hypothetical protein n=1 Tax=unclassified Nannocystis TaxID=2627009 RepID=UPI00226E4D28|nr:MULTISPECIES: hypothetical protein [unclassified Nannocystis]MCY0988515.1 hypothetical protein [Nannocystis sp. ILAH1]MCY1067523.1 hypothetical protein [Nannocystis sp. RBIL2]